MGWKFPLVCSYVALFFVAPSSQAQSACVNMVGSYRQRDGMTLDVVQSTRSGSGIDQFRVILQGRLLWEDVLAKPMVELDGQLRSFTSPGTRGAYEASCQSDRVLLRIDQDASQGRPAIRYTYEFVLTPGGLMLLQNQEEAGRGTSLPVRIFARQQ